MTIKLRAVALACLMLAAGQTPARAQFADPLPAQVRELGTATYQANCAACHENAGSHAPSAAGLGTLSPDIVLRALTTGRMQAQAAHLSDEQRAAVAQVLTNQLLGSAPAEAPLARCTGSAAVFDFAQPAAFSGWGLDARNSHAIATQAAGITSADLPRLKLRWAFAIPNAIEMRSQPAIAGGALYVGGTNGTLYALDLATGCARWTYQAAAGVRTGVVISQWTAGDTSARPTAYFGDSLGNAYAVDATTGAELWVRRAGDHGQAIITGAPALSGNTLFVPISSGEEGSAALPTYECCTFRGSLLALDAQTGAELWRTYLVGEPQQQGTNSAGTALYGPSGVAVWSTPLVDPARGLVYVLTGDNYSQPATELSDALVALDVQTGEIAWATQVTPGDSWNVACWANSSGPNCPADAGPDHDFGAAPILAQGADGREYLLAGQKSGVALAFDPGTGEILWQTRVGRGGVLGGIHFGIAADSGRLYAPVFDGGPPNGDAEPARPGISAIDVASGEVLWHHAAQNLCTGKPMCEPGYSAAITVTPELVLAGATDAHFRILSATSGEVLWDVDTDREFTSVNGTTGRGGSMSGGAAAIAWDGNLIISSGYAFLGKIPGNVVLVYGLD
jgi:polyvinyl alcohol dehydrogenase (cytochrome)